MQVVLKCSRQVCMYLGSVRGRVHAFPSAPCTGTGSVIQTQLGSLQVNWGSTLIRCTIVRTCIHPSHIFGKFSKQFVSVMLFQGKKKLIRSNQGLSFSDTIQLDVLCQLGMFKKRVKVFQVYFQFFSLMCSEKLPPMVATGNF